MTDGTANAETEALIEAGGELFERIRRGEDVEADLGTWSKGIDRITGRRPSRVFAKVEAGTMRLQIKINVVIQAKGEHLA